MNTTQAAEKVGTTPRMLRRFIRQSNKYRNAGCGGRYEFQATDIPQLKKHFEAWHTTIVTKVERPTVSRETLKKNYSDDDSSPDTVPVSAIRSARSRAQIKAAAEARVDRLEAMLKASGLHISQAGVAKTNKVSV